MQVARGHLIASQQVLDLDLSAADPAPGDPQASGAVVASSASQVLWDLLTNAYILLGFDALEDDAFRSMVLARIVESASKLATPGILEEFGVDSPHRNTLMTALGRCQDRDYRGKLAAACIAYTTKTNGLITIHGVAVV